MHGVICVLKSICVQISLFSSHTGCGRRARRFLPGMSLWECSWHHPALWSPHLRFERLPWVHNTGISVGCRFLQGTESETANLSDMIPRTPHIYNQFVYTQMSLKSELCLWPDNYRIQDNISDTHYRHHHPGLAAVMAIFIHSGFLSSCFLLRNKPDIWQR